MNSHPTFAIALLITAGTLGCSNTNTNTESNASEDVGSQQDVENQDNPDAPDDDEDVDGIDASIDTGPPVPTYDFAASQPWFTCPQEEFPEGAIEVTAIDGVHQYFGSENLRRIETDVTFPEPGNWAQVGMWFQLECPDGLICDHWDRAGSVQLVLNPDDPAEEWQRLEILRHITPYRVSMCQYVDVTSLGDLLTGAQKISSFIDTWVGPGHAQGEGWKVTAKFVFIPGSSATPADVINIWGRRNITVGEIEDDANVDSQIDPVTFTIPEDATRVEAHLTTTGHSFGNTNNCAEFCQMRHDIIVNGTVHSVNPWRPDCDQNPVSNQLGTWTYARNGWCPGAVALGHTVDITEALTLGGDNELDFSIVLPSGSEYDNRRPVELLPYTLVSLKLYVYK